MKSLTLILFAHFLCLNVFSQSTSTFTGNELSAPNDWNQANNWMPLGVPLSGQKVIIIGDSVILENIRPNLHSINITDGTLHNKSEIGIMNVDTFGIRCYDSKLINDGKIIIAETGGETSIYNANRSAIYLENNSELITSGVIRIEKSGYGITLNNSSLTNISFGFISIFSNATSLSVQSASQIINSDNSSTINANRTLSILFGSTVENRGFLIVEQVEIKANAILNNYGMIFMDNSTIFSTTLNINNGKLNQFSDASLTADGTFGTPVVLIENNSNVTISANSTLTVVGSSLLDRIEVTDSTFECLGVLDVN